MPNHKRLKRKRLTGKQPPTLLILAGIALLLIAIFAFKSDGDSSTSVTSLECSNKRMECARAHHPY